LLILRDYGSRHGCVMRQHELVGSRVPVGLATAELARRNVAEFSKVSNVKGFMHIDGMQSSAEDCGRCMSGPSGVRSN
jgi:hypothetical protein